MFDNTLEVSFSMSYKIENSNMQLSQRLKANANDSYYAKWGKSCLTE